MNILTDTHSVRFKKDHHMVLGFHGVLGVGCNKEDEKNGWRKYKKMFKMGWGQMMQRIGRGGFDKLVL